MEEPTEYKKRYKALLEELITNKITRAEFNQKEKDLFSLVEISPNLTIDDTEDLEAEAREELGIENFYETDEDKKTWAEWTKSIPISSMLSELFEMAYPEHKDLPFTLTYYKELKEELERIEKEVREN